MTDTSKLSLSGWLPDLPDFRDLVFSPKIGAGSLPPIVDLRQQDAPIYDQGRLNSCTGNALASLFQFVNKKDAGQDFIPSRLFIYYGEREIDGSTNRDGGAKIRDGMKVLAKKGVCKETTWPYVESKVKTKPSKESYSEALNHQAIRYERIKDTIGSMKQCLADGYPFVFGFTTYESLRSPEVAKTGIMKMPQKSEKTEGGHAVMAVGYDDSRQVMILRNSWGAWWGDKGYFYMPYDYITDGNLADDFWTLRKVEL